MVGFIKYPNISSAGGIKSPYSHISVRLFHIQVQRFCLILNVHLNLTHIMTYTEECYTRYVSLHLRQRQDGI